MNLPTQENSGRPGTTRRHPDGRDESADVAGAAGNEDRWSRLMALLGPFHRQAQTTARRIAASSHEGDDLFQDAVLHAFRKLDSLRDEARFRSWFFAVLLSRHRSRTRQGFWRRFLPLEDRIQAGEEPADARQRGADHDWIGARRLRRALSTLPAPEREVLVLRELQGFSTEEIAEMQGVSPSTVRSRFSRGRDRVRKLYRRRGWLDASDSPRSSGSGAVARLQSFPFGGSS